MGRVALTWNGDELISEIENVQKRKLEAICRAVVRKYRELLGIQGTKDTPSRPGEPPRKQSGTLVESLWWSVQNFGRMQNQATIGIDDEALHGLYLDQGTGRIQARPWVMRGLNESLGEAMRILQE